jgi:hypothetical protein
MNEKEALSVIEQMIATARQDVKDNGFFFMLWGWLVLAGALTNYVMLVWMHSPYASLVWAILMPLGGIISFIAGMRERKEREKRVNTYLDEMMKYIVRAFVVSLFIVCVMLPFNNQNWQVFFPVLMVLYGYALYIFGGVLRFRLLNIGGMINWLLASIAFFVTYDIQLLLLALAVLCGYIIPGHTLNSRFRKDV